MRDDNLQSDDLALPSAVVDGSGPSVRALKKGDRVWVFIPANPPARLNAFREYANLRTTPRQSAIAVSVVNDKGRKYQVRRDFVSPQRANAENPQPANGSREEPQQQNEERQ